MRTGLIVALVAVLTVTASQGTNAQDFPSRVVKIVVPYPAGGGVDNLARPIAEQLSKAWGQSVVIENKPGAATMIGGQEVARAQADGPRCCLPATHRLPAIHSCLRKCCWIQSRI